MIANSNEYRICCLILSTMTNGFLRICCTVSEMLWPVWHYCIHHNTGYRIVQAELLLQIKVKGQIRPYGNTRVSGRLTRQENNNAVGGPKPTRKRHNTRGKTQQRSWQQPPLCTSSSLLILTNIILGSLPSCFLTVVFSSYTHKVKLQIKNRCFADVSCYPVHSPHSSQSPQARSAT